ncbi:MAG: Succinyl-diaminopimelate desuccinylase [Alphaproteobacteria bacterium MarineAlpha9_Bin1]|nr:MAG: Succinyl-diaminopimelate desuccinylase [Alphaproteobacteria bacterium MarineAlpha9_Bin1]
MKKKDLCDPLNLAKALINCPSETPKEAGAILALKKALSELGFVCRIISSGDANAKGKEALVYNLYAKKGKGKNLCFAGHTDVVPAGPLKEWDFPPFEAKTSEGKLFGRGAADMKGAIAAFVAASARFFNDEDKNFSVSFLITGDEEGHALHGTKAVLSELKKLGEVINHCIVGEPTNPARLGEMIKIGRRGSLHGKLIVEGRQGHVAYPYLAVNPLTYLANLVSVLSNIQLDKGNKYFQPSNLEFVSIDTGNNISNVIPHNASANFNIRFNNLYSEKTLIDKIRKILKTDLSKSDGIKWTLETELSGEPFLTPPGKFVDLIKEAVNEVTSLKPELSTSGGTSDARFIKDICPVIEFGSVGKTMHQTNECISLDDLEQLTEIYENILHRYGKVFS